MAAQKTKEGWYSVSEETLRGLGRVIVGTLLIGAVGAGYLAWDQLHVRRATVEVLERARGLRLTVDEEGGPESHGTAYSEASAAFDEAEEAWRQRTYRSALSKAELSRDLLLSILDSIRDPERAGDARLIYVEGSVELRRGETGAFREARSRDVLYEGDYIRTASGGSAEILFGRDGALFTVRPDTLLKVNRTVEKAGNPQSVGIEYGWVDLSTTGAQGEVKTEFAQLTLEERSAGSVTVDPDTSIGVFVVGRGSGALAAATIGEVIEIESGEILQVGENLEISELHQVVQEELRVSIPKPLPTAPVIEDPPDNMTINMDERDEVVLSWKPVQESAVTYAFQVSRSRLFAEQVVDVAGRSRASARLQLLGEGTFYWRIASETAAGAQGPWSAERRFRVASLGMNEWADTEPPILEVTDVWVNGHILIVSGRTEPGARLEIDGQPIKVNADGTFSRSITKRTLGVVPLVITAVDASGNRVSERREALIEEL